MSNTISYRGYTATVSYSNEDQALIGKVINIRDIIVFEGQSISEVTEAFEESIDLYLEHCEEQGISPSKPYSGNFQVRTTSELHEKFHVAAEGSAKSLNQWIVDCAIMSLQVEKDYESSWIKSKKISVSSTEPNPIMPKDQVTIRQ